MIENLKLQPNGGHGYFLLVEGVTPYNTAEGQLSIETLSNHESFQLAEVQSCEPVEYTDAYVPSKYGIIFKEKLIVSPTDNTSASMNIKLQKGGVDLSAIEGMSPKYFRVDILDNGKVIHQQTGYNQITISHFMFRCNNNLPDEQPEDGNPTEVKHNYVIQGVFDLNEWPECKTENEDTAEVSWMIKMYSSETLAMIKDTDKEDREAQLKASWETEEPGRAEKARVSR